MEYKKYIAILNLKHYNEEILKLQHENFQVKCKLINHIVKVNTIRICSLDPTY